MVFSFWWIAGAIALFWIIGAHNRLVRLRAAVAQSFVGVQAALQQWVDLALPASLHRDPAQSVSAPQAEPDAGAAGEGGSAGETKDAEAPAPSADELDAWAGLGAAARQVQLSGQALGVRPRDRKAAAALVAAMQAVRSAWDRVGLAGRSTLTTEEAALAALWMQQDTHVRLSCAQFNESVARYNAALRQFPAMVLAWLLRFQPAGMLE